MRLPVLPSLLLAATEPSPFCQREGEFAPLVFFFRVSSFTRSGGRLRSSGGGPPPKSMATLNPPPSTGTGGKGFDFCERYGVQWRLL